MSAVPNYTSLYYAYDKKAGLRSSFAKNRRAKMKLLKHIMQVTKNACVLIEEEGMY